MFSRIWLINLVLAAGIIFFGLKAYGVWSEEYKRPSEIGPIKKPLPWPGNQVAKISVAPESHYEVVVNKNLFSVERSELKPQEQKKKLETKSKADARLLKLLESAYKQTDLYGVTIMDDYKVAFITETSAGGSTKTKRPARVNKRGVKRVKVGDTVGRFKVKEIEKTSVLLTAGGREWRVSLFDKDKPKKRVPIKKPAGPVAVGAGSKREAVQQPVGTGEKKVPTKRGGLKGFDKAQNKRRILPVPNTPGPDKR